MSYCDVKMNTLQTSIVSTGKEMTGRNHFDYGRYFFHSGVSGESGSGGPPLVCLNGGIMADTGSEAPAYIFTCQDRYPVYAGLGGMRCLLFVRDDKQARRYQKRLTTIRRHLNMINQVTGLLPNCNLPEPLYMPCDLNSLDDPWSPGGKFLEQIRDPQVLNAQVLGGIYLNQVSPTITKLMGQLYGFLQNNGADLQIRLPDYQRMGQCALHWHDKTHYVELLRQYQGSDSLPLHVPTAMFSSQHLQCITWEQLMDLVRDQVGDVHTGDYFVKSGMDAAGEVSIILNQNNFAQKTRELTREIGVKINQMNRTQSEVQLLVQPRIERTADHDGPTSVGITYHIHDPERIERLAVAGHVYEDRERKTFIGSYLSDQLTRQVLDTVGEDKIIALLRLFAWRGYRGPINLDAIRNLHGEYIFIYDCNPRMGGVLPGLMLKNAFQRAGLPTHTQLTLGYQGRIVYPDLQAKLAELKKMDLLYTKNCQRGVYIIPSLVRPDSFDLILINMEMKEIHEFIDSGLIHSLSDDNQSDLPGVYL